MCDSPELLAKLDELLKLTRENGGDTKKPVEQSYVDSYYLISNTQSNLYLDFKGRKHLYIYSPNPLTLQLNDLGTMPIFVNTWTDISLRPGQQIFTTNQASPVEVLVRATNEIIEPTSAPVIMSAAMNFVAASSGNAAALTNATDYVFKWTGPVNHIMIQNNTSITINWELDAATSLGSPILSNTVGQNTLFLDVQCVALHLQGAGTPNVNGTTPSNIVVRGWQ